MYSDNDILQAVKDGKVTVQPWHPEHVSGATLDLTLDENFLIFETQSVSHIDIQEPFDVTKKIKASPNGGFVIHPGEFILGSTAEKITLSSDVAGILEGRSSLGRLGLIIHATASMVKPGFAGFLTLEMSNISHLPVKLYPGMRIAQLALIELKTPSQQAYGASNKYQEQERPTPSKIWQDYQ